MTFQILGLRSKLVPENEVNRLSSEFITKLESKIGIPIEWVESTGSFRKDSIPLIFIQTGGTENQFAQILDQISQPVMLLTHGAMNSLAASMEILTYLKQHGYKGEIIHGELDYVTSRLRNLNKIHKTRHFFSGAKLGVIGKPSDWLIASHVDKDLAYKKFGFEIVDIPIEELIELSKKDYTFENPLIRELQTKPFQAGELQKALNIYGALCKLVDSYQLKGLTLRCFDLLDTLHSTGCIGLALLNATGIPSSCEGDVPALISMMIIESLLGKSSFMVNPSRLLVRENSLIVAHCTLPINMGEAYSLKTHFESGIGVAVDSQLPVQNALMFKIAADLECFFLSEIDILENLSENNLCRTQIKISLHEDISYFLKEPCGNHHLIALSRDLDLLRDYLSSLEMDSVSLD